MVVQHQSFNSYDLGVTTSTTAATTSSNTAAAATNFIKTNQLPATVEATNNNIINLPNKLNTTPPPNDQDNTKHNNSISSTSSTTTSTSSSLTSSNTNNTGSNISPSSSSSTQQHNHQQQHDNHQFINGNNNNMNHTVDYNINNHHSSTTMTITPTSTATTSPEMKKGRIYWCWLLKEYIRLGHVKSMQRVLRILDQMDPYIFQWSDNIYLGKSYHDNSSSSSLSIPKSNGGVSALVGSNNNNSINDIYIINSSSKPIVNAKRASIFPHLYIPNLLRLRSDLFQCFNKSFSFNSILNALSSGNIESLLNPKYIPVPKSLPIVPFLLVIVYIKMCLTKPDGLKSIVNVIMDCQQKIHLFPVYDYPHIPLDVLLKNMLTSNLRFVDWDPISLKLLPTEVYFNEIFEVFYLTGRESILYPKQQPQQQQQIANNNQQQQPQGFQRALPKSLTPTLVYPSEDYHFKTIKTYLNDSAKIVFYNIRYLTQRRNSFELSIWNEENVNILLNCTIYHLDQYCKEKKTSQMAEDLSMVLDSCLRLSLSWVSIISGVQEVKEKSDNCWWVTKPKKLQPILKSWVNTIERIFEEVDIEKLFLIGLVWLGISVSLFDESDETEHNNSYYLFIKYIKKYPDMLSDYNKSSLVIKSIGFALIGVQTIEQTTELINIMSSLWDDPHHKATPFPSLDNGWLVYKTVQSVFNSKFKLTNFDNNQSDMENAIFDWTKVICEESNNSFYNTNSSSKYLSIFIGSSISNILQKRCQFIPLEAKKGLVNQIHDMFYTSVNQINYLTVVQKIGVVTAYCLSGTEPFQDKQACQSILKVTIDILLEQVLGINGQLFEWLDKPIEINNLSIKKMEGHQTSPIFLSFLSYLDMIVKLMLHLKDNDVNKSVMLKLCEYGHRFNELWYNFVKDTTSSFPKSSIQRALKPTFNGIIICFSTMFNDISRILSPIDSALGLEFFIHISFITDDDVPVINSAIRSLVRNVSRSECAITRFIDKMPIYLTVPKNDKIACAKVIIYLNALVSLVTHVPHNLITNVIIPNLFEYMEYPIEKMNTLTHIIISRIFSIPDYHLTIQMVPKYIQTSLKTFPKYTQISSLFTGISSIVEHNPPTDPIILFTVMTIANATIKQIKLQDKTKSSLDNSSKSLFQLLLSMLQLVDIQMLNLVLKEVKKVVSETQNLKIKMELCTSLISEITGNFENSKKNLCLSWYLDLIKEYEFSFIKQLMNQQKLQQQQQQNPKTAYDMLSPPK